MSITTSFKDDLRASIVVFLVALPLCLGISLASGAPLFSGVLAGMIGGLIVGFFSSSTTSVSGPAAGLAVIVLGAINSLGDFYIFTLAVFLAGLIQIALGLIKAGQVGSYFPNSVIKGMLAAIGIILILKQIPHAIGFDKSIIGDDAFFQMDGENTFSEILKALGAFKVGAIIISLISFSTIILWGRLAKKGLSLFQTVPGPLVAIVASVLANELLLSQFGLTALEKEHFVNLPVEGGLASFLNAMQPPEWSALSNAAVYKIAFTLAIVASLETMLSVEAADKIDPHKNTTNKNRELIAQGIGNSVAGLIGALPLTSVVVRTTANIDSGAVSKLSTILHGLWLLLAMIAFPIYLQHIPLASLATILILVGFKLAHPSLFKNFLSLGWIQFIPFVTTILAILFTDLLMGIIIGLVVGFIFVLRSNVFKSIVVVHDNNDYLIRFMKDVSFLNKPAMESILDGIPHGAHVIIDGSSHLYIDNDIVALIKDFLEVTEERNIHCEIIRSSYAMNDFFKVQK